MNFIIVNEVFILNVNKYLENKIKQWTKSFVFWNILVWSTGGKMYTELYRKLKSFKRWVLLKIALFVDIERRWPAAFGWTGIHFGDLLRKLI